MTGYDLRVNHSLSRSAAVALLRLWCALERKGVQWRKCFETISFQWRCVGSCKTAYVCAAANAERCRCTPLPLRGSLLGFFRTELSN